MIVADASAILEVVMQMPAAAIVEARLFEDPLPLHAPHLVDIEVAQVLRRFAANGKTAPARCREALDEFQGLPLRRYAHDALLPRVWELRNNLTAYDAAYVALAEALDATLVTRDRRLAAATGHRARVALV